MADSNSDAALDALATLSDVLGVHRHYVDGLHRPVDVPPETLVRICAALGAEVESIADAPEALRAHRARPEPPVQPVIVAWDGVVPEEALPSGGSALVTLTLESGEPHAVDPSRPLPPGYHRLEVEGGGESTVATVISSPTRAWTREGTHRSWGVGTHLAALRSERSRSLADLRDFERVCRWVGARGGDLVTALPLLPTFNADPPEPSPYSPVSRLFWSELVLDLGEHHRPVGPVSTLDVRAADREVRAALAQRPDPDPTDLDEGVRRYARFRGAQARLGRNWRDWPAEARAGRLGDDVVDPDEERFHLKAQHLVREQLRALDGRLAEDGLRVGLDLAVGVHPDGYDPWSRPGLFAGRMSVGAPPDGGFPSGQDWGFSPVLPVASRAEGHRYVADSIAHQSSLAGVLRIDHVMALTRLYWIPHGFGLDQGTYVSYPAEELFAVLVLESHRHRCEVVGENLGTVPAEIHESLPRHGIPGMTLAIFDADAPDAPPPGPESMALIDTHDTPTLVGWLEGRDIDERIRAGLLDPTFEDEERERRAASAERLADLLGVPLDDQAALLDELLVRLGRSESPLVVPWIEDLWLEADQVNLPGTRSSERPNWQRPMRRLLDDVLSDPVVDARARLLRDAREASVDS